VAAVLPRPAATPSAPPAPDPLGASQEAADRAARFGWALLVALNVVDLLLTRRFLALGGAEGNPLMAFAVRSWRAAAAKAFVLAVLALRFATRPATVARLALVWLAVGFYVLAAYVNWGAVQALSR
jgi:hypothetical protein